MSTSSYTQAEICSKVKRHSSSFTCAISMHVACQKPGEQTCSSQIHLGVPLRLFQVFCYLVLEVLMPAPYRQNSGDTLLPELSPTDPKHPRNLSPLCNGHQSALNDLLTPKRSVHPPVEYHMQRP